MNKLPLCITHAQCMDGLGAAWAVWKTLKGQVEIVPMTYDERADKFPKLDLEDREVIIVDFSIPPKLLLPHAESISRLLMLDHHDTMEKDWAFTYGIPSHFILKYSSTESGAMLAWQYQNVITAMVSEDTGWWRRPLLDLNDPSVKTDIPLAIQHIDDRDRWQFKIPGSRELHAFLKLSGFPGQLTHERFMVFDEIRADLDNLSDYRERVYENGTSATMAERETIRGIIESFAARRTVLDFDVPVCAVPYSMASEAGHLMLDQMKGPFSLTYCDDHKLGKRHYSLRSNKGFSVEAIAKHFGGGGRETTAGFVTALGSPFVWDYEDNTLTR